MTPPEVAELLAGLPTRWWIAGGWALDLFTDRRLREHADIDISILRDDQEALRAHLAGWDLQLAGGGQVEPWRRQVQVPAGASLWARREPSGPWNAQFLLEAHDADVWRYRRDPTISLPVAEIGAVSHEAVPYLRPEVVLLFKTRESRPRDEADFEAVLPALPDAARARLVSWLPDSHAWRQRL